MGGVNYSAKALSKEKSFHDLIFGIVGGELLSDKEWSVLFGNEGQEINVEKETSQKTITSLNSSTIVGVSYDKATPPRKNNVASSIDVVDQE